MTNYQAALQQYLDRKQALEAENTIPADFRQLLGGARERHGSKPVLNYFDQGRALNAEELYQEVYTLADGLAQIGIGKASHVAVLLSNRIEFPITWLALGVLGAVMLPVNTRYTGSELDYLANDGDAEFLITENALVGTYNAMQQCPENLTKNHIVVIDAAAGSPYHDWHAVRQSGSADFQPDWGVTGDDLMNIQYTSGTTGFPKGCMQSQRYWLLLGYSVGALMPGIHSILSDHPFFYMDPQWQLIQAIQTGACVYTPSKISSSKFLERIRTYGIEMAFFPRPLISEAAKPEDRKTTLKKLFALGMGAKAQEILSERFGIPIYEAFGMTEIGPGLLVPDELVNDPNILGNCGVAAPFREARVALDEDGTEAPRGEVGELWIRGDSILSGYYNKPEANAESFHEGWFRTGDLFIQNESGYFRIVGRKKDMIRRSGENISALEVEQALSAHPQIKQAAAVAVPDDYRGEEVKVYLLLRDGESAESITPEQVIAYCITSLAIFKLPRFIAYVSEFPYTPSEKVAKHKLVARCDNLRANSFDVEQCSWLGENGNPSGMERPR